MTDVPVVKPQFRVVANAPEYTRPSQYFCRNRKEADEIFDAIVARQRGTINGLCVEMFEMSETLVRQDRDVVPESPSTPTNQNFCVICNVPNCERHAADQWRRP